jgi:ribonuclease BN (tRNA processing enzyme)
MHRHNKKITLDFKLNRPKFGRLTFVDVFSRRFFYAKGAIKINALRNVHTPGSFAICIRWLGKTLGYTSDTAISDNLLRNFNNCDYLIHECLASSRFFKKYPSLNALHTDAKTLATRLKALPVKKVIPVHMLLTEKNEIARIRKELIPIKNKLLWVKDLQRVELR